MNTNRLIRWLILAIVMLSLSGASFAEVFISVRFGPPAIPVYAQPICPGPGYFWTPGYWAWDDDGGYYWVPGTWVMAPVGMYWTPGYWGWYGGYYRWHPGYWGPHVGFYGGINYGYGYTGVGFYGGEWRGGRFFYNRSVTNVNVVHVTNVYNRTVVVHNNTRVSYNGGSGGINARPTRDEERWSREPHREALGDQREHEHSARRDRALFASENHGRPAIAATGRPGDFHGRDAIGAREAGGQYHEPKISPREARENRGVETRNDSWRNNAPRPDNRDRNTQMRQNRPEPRQERDYARQNKEQQRQAQQEQKRYQQEQKQRVQQQKAERKQAQQEQKRQREEQKHEDRRPQR
jgi:hypothetical protein